MRAHAWGPGGHGVQPGRKLRGSWLLGLCLRPGPPPGPSPRPSPPAEGLPTVLLRFLPLPLYVCMPLAHLCTHVCTGRNAHSCTILCSAPRHVCTHIHQHTHCSWPRGYAESRAHVGFPRPWLGAREPPGIPGVCPAAPCPLHRPPSLTHLSVHLSLRCSGDSQEAASVCLAAAPAPRPHLPASLPPPHPRLCLPIRLVTQPRHLLKDEVPPAPTPGPASQREQP